MRKKLAGAVLAGVMVVSMGGTAVAGEITGGSLRPPQSAAKPTPKPTPIKDNQARSVCSFSGQNDNPTSPELFDGGRVQSFGDIVQEAIDVFGDGKGASALVPIITAEGPGVECPGIHRE